MDYLVLLFLAALAVFVVSLCLRSRHPFILALLFVVLVPLLAIAMLFFLPGQVDGLREMWYANQGGGDPFGSGMMVAMFMTAGALGLAGALCIVIPLALIWRKGARRTDTRRSSSDWDRLSNAP
ncbi:MAG TPA: hypothetical protein VEL74_16505 [Thermoanaerobaculia bacterium]|nr:hypothetical protein [Thermoanaerobaculia bacterium]